MTVDLESVRARKRADTILALVKQLNNLITDAASDKVSVNIEIAYADEREVGEGPGTDLFRVSVYLDLGSVE